MMWNHGSWGAGDWLAMTLMMLVFWGGLVVLIVWLVRNYRHETTRSTPESPDGSGRPDVVLAERFASGEIDEDEFRRRRDVLHTPTTRS
jgi:putative membrane protein